MRDWTNGVLQETSLTEDEMRQLWQLLADGPMGPGGWLVEQIGDGTQALVHVDGLAERLSDPTVSREELLGLLAAELEEHAATVRAMLRTSAGLQQDLAKAKEESRRLKQQRQELMAENRRLNARLQRARRDIVALGHFTSYVSEATVNPEVKQRARQMLTYAATAYRRLT